MSAGSIGQQIINGTYGLDNRSPTAYEELKAWCEKYLEVDDYKIVPKSEYYFTTIYFDPLANDNNIPCFMFDTDGSFQHLSVCSESEMIEHIENYEGQDEDKKEIEPPHYSPPPNSIGGQMVRRMIEMYERQTH